MQFHAPHTTGRYIIWLALLAIALLALYGLSFFVPGLMFGQDAAEEPFRPAFTEEVAAQLAASQGFAALISYTDAGFEPQTALVRVGDTVRFTNNSSGDMWIAASGSMGSVYPGPGACGQSAFDVCKTIGRGMFYEFTFEREGTWGFQNNSDASKIGAIIVE